MSISAAVEGGRRLIEATFLDRCVILDAIDIADNSGGQTTTLVPRVLSVPCRFTQMSETDVRLVAGAAYGPATAVLQISIDTDAPEGAYVQNVDHDSAFWLIVGDRTPPSATAAVRRLLVREATWR